MDSSIHSAGITPAEVRGEQFVSIYPLLVVAGIAVTFTLWSRLARRDHRLVLIYLWALVSAFAGAKLVYLAAEGWMFASSPDRWLIWATGKTILGALLGGYLGVELVKKMTGYAQPTGDWFALVTPLGILLGRIGCLLHGCCLGERCAPAWWTLADARGEARWPAVPLEIAFNVFALGAVFVLRRLRLAPGQHFHLYLIAYGLFRFAHEWMRATPKIVLGLSGYHVAALAVTALGILGFVRRQREQQARH